MKDEAKAILKAMFQPEQMARVMETGGGYYFPPYKKLGDIDFFKNDPWNTMIVENVLPYAKSYFYKGTPTAWTSLHGGWCGEMLMRVVVDGWEPAKAVEEAEEKLEEIIASHDA
jgi:hypothetical protein